MKAITYSGKETGISQLKKETAQYCGVRRTGEEEQTRGARGERES